MNEEKEIENENVIRKKVREKKTLEDFIDFFVADKDSTVRKKAKEEGCKIPFYNDPGHGKSNLYRTLEKKEIFGKRYSRVRLVFN